MPLWTLTRAPYFAPTAEITNKGWTNPATGEVLVAIRQLAEKAGPATIQSVTFPETITEAEDFTVTVKFSEAVDVDGFATLTVSNDDGDDIVLTSDEDATGNELTFTGTNTALAGNNLSIAEQTLTGTIVDSGTVTASTADVTEAVSLAAGTVEVAAA